MNDKNEKVFSGVFIPKDIWLTDKLKPMEKFFLLEINGLDKKKGCYATNSHFSKLFHVSTSRCTQIIGKLESEGWVKTQLIYKENRVESRIIRMVNKLTTDNKGTDDITNEEPSKTSGKKINGGGKKINGGGKKIPRVLNTITNNNEYKEKEINKEKTTDDIRSINELKKYKPDLVRHDLWESFLVARKNRKATQSERAINGVVRELEKCTSLGIDNNYAIEIFLEESWKGFKADWINNQLQSAHKNIPNNQLSEFTTKTQKTIEAGLAWLSEG